MRKILYLLFITILINSCTRQKSEPVLEETVTIEELASMFYDPPTEYFPYVWWHWMGSNFSKEGIRKDLEAMKEAGIGGATIFNLTSAVQESNAPIGNNPWPDQTYRSEAYWMAMRYAASEAKRLGIKLGLHNSPGYSTTGGPWIDEKRGMQIIVSGNIKIKGDEKVQLQLQTPELPVYKGWGSNEKQATFYRDIAVIAVPDKKNISIEDLVDITAFMDSTGFLIWDTDEGPWNIYRIGHAPSMSAPHPVPDDLIGKVLEVDKMSKEHNIYHWENVLNPLTRHLGKYIGNTITHILIDSYEAGNQNWTAEFREKFQELKGYDPIPWIALREFREENDAILRFNNDYDEVVNRLFIDNGWKVAKEMIHKTGLQLFWEPYEGPFDTQESVSIADLPMGEFWNNGSGAISSDITNAARNSGKKLVGAEAFTGRPEVSQHTEDPAFLKHTADGSFLSGANLLFLHHWVHQPFDDEYQPGMGMGWWGTHFGRNQTWIKPGKSFFRYLSRCQMLLQQGRFIDTEGHVLHRSMPDAELFFVINPSEIYLDSNFVFDVCNREPQLWYPDKGIIQKVKKWGKQNDSTCVNLSLHPDESVFVIFVSEKQNNFKDKILPATEITKEFLHPVEGEWQIVFEPKLEEPFEYIFSSLTDFKDSDLPEIKYFSGTATYSKKIKIDNTPVSDKLRIILDLGELHDIAELFINGENAGVLWYPPYETDISDFVRSGENIIEIKVTNNWANRLIGDEQYEADFEWGRDRGILTGRAMKDFPDWFINKQQRPSRERKTFNIWYYYRRDSDLKPAGLIGPVQIKEVYYRIIRDH